jgi:23S rRNA pseudouridine2605 synthase
MTQENHKDERIAKERIAKVMARAGLCSRREAEKWIEAGRVRVNGKVIESAAMNVSGADKVVVDGKDLPPQDHTRLYIYHKPPGLVTSHKDERGRTTVFDKLASQLPRVISVGRLDLNTEGLLLLTNDGELSRYLELPSTGWKRKYRVRVHGWVGQKKLDRLKNGITVEGITYKSIDAKLDEQEKEGTNSWLNVTLREGKNREIRRVMEALDLKVTRLIRTDYGPFSLGKLERGGVREIEDKVMRTQVAKFFKEKTLKR